MVSGSLHCRGCIVAVVGSDIRPGRAVGGPSGVRFALLVLAFVSAFLGVCGWLLGASYTLRGWVIALNWLASSLGLPDRLVAPAGYMVLLALPLGLVYSSIEVYLSPRRSVYGGLSRLIGLRLVGLVVFLWLFVICTDVGSTFLAVVSPGSGSSLLAIQVARSLPVASAWSLLLSFLPESLFILAWVLVSRAALWKD